MEICRKKESIVLKDNEIIEEYTLDSEIKFEKLFKYLLGLNLSKKIIIKNKIDDMNDIEENLIKIIMKIITNYNDKVDELASFINDNKQ